ncbi:multicopper oxidase domain-containing protein [Cyanobacterium aponinum UTEX 3221]|uniref:multicopper oxidase domain-containing protein n=1 Tax=Cyanobacterium aponinum TaxID=379064 RepID=UPI002B4BCB1D|nr:multicopper oxidase domain-containing protein [Cyanobacterium aponinum]WRL37588.1 multicopper oxidase domain-containing protein [Cyanobacterium aponinum UTEX 3221]
MIKLNRRQLMIFSLFSTGGIIAQKLLSNKNNNLSWAKSTPAVYKSKNGLLEVELIAQEIPVNIGGKTAYLLTYNGQIPAPRLEAKAGDKVKIKFTNKLNNSTNLHYHGLHISPNNNADNVFLEIKPNQTVSPSFTRIHGATIIRRISRIIYYQRKIRRNSGY